MDNRHRWLVDDGKPEKIRGGLVSHPKHQQGAIVVRIPAGSAVRIRGREDSVGDDAGVVFGSAGCQHLREAFRAEFLSEGIVGLHDAVGSENHHVTGQQIEGLFVILRAAKQAQRDAFEMQLADLPVAQQQRVGATGVGHREAARHTRRRAWR